MVLEEFSLLLLLHKNLVPKAINHVLLPLRVVAEVALNLLSEDFGRQVMGLQCIYKLDYFDAVVLFERGSSEVHLPSLLLRGFIAVLGHQS